MYTTHFCNNVYRYVQIHNYNKHRYLVEFTRLCNNFYRYVQIHNYNKRRYLVECTRLISVITSTDTFKVIIIINAGIWLIAHDSAITSTDRNQTMGKSNKSKLSSYKKAKVRTNQLRLPMPEGVEPQI